MENDDQQSEITWNGLLSIWLVIDIKWLKKTQTKQKKNPKKTNKQKKPQKKPNKTKNG